MPLVLNGTTGVSGVDGSVSTPAVQGSDTNTGVYFPAADTVAIAAGGTEAFRATSGGNLSLTGTMAMGSSFLRNRIINGDMRIDQRNAGVSVTPTTGSYTLDRWRAILTVASKFSVQQNAGSVTPPSGYTSYLGITSLSAYSVLAADYFGVVQYIEGVNTYDLGWGAANPQSVTLSFWVRSSLTGTFGGSIANAAGTRCYPFTYSISSANTWEQKSVTIPGDTTGTWLKDTSTGMQVIFGLGVGSTYSGTASAWSGTTYISATGATSVVGTNAATWYITGVQLEAGTQATPFERRLYGQELALCQRYCIGMNSTGILGQAFAATSAAYFYNMPTSMRTVPAFSTTSGFTTSTAGGGSVSVPPTVTSFTGPNIIRIDVTNATSLTAGNATVLATPSSVNLSAEL